MNPNKRTKKRKAKSKENRRKKNDHTAQQRVMENLMREVNAELKEKAKNIPGQKMGFFLMVDLVNAWGNRRIKADPRMRKMITYTVKTYTDRLVANARLAELEDMEARQKAEVVAAEKVAKPDGGK